MKSAPLFITDCGLATPLGCGKKNVAKALYEGQCGLSSKADVIDGSSVWVGAVKEALPVVPLALEDLNCRNNRLMQIALMEIEVSVEQAKIKYGLDRIAVVMGTSTAGIAEGEDAFARFFETGVWPESFHYRQQELSGLSVFVARYFSLTGPAYTIATACSSSAKVFACARRLINAGVVDAAIVGGADTLCRMTVNGFNALSLLSDRPCNPFSRNRNGITIGEGASVFLLEKEGGPVALLGIGETSDAYHLTAPDPAGEGAKRAMQQALNDASLKPDEIAYINLHGTASQLNDAMEAQAVASVFGNRMPCSSTKGSTGHMLGATGGCEAAFLWLTLNPTYNVLGRLPPHLWDGIVDPDLPALAFVGKEVSLFPSEKRAMMTNVFGFGGNNVSLILGRDPAYDK